MTQLQHQPDPPLLPPDRPLSSLDAMTRICEAAIEELAKPTGEPAIASLNGGLSWMPIDEAAARIRESAALPMPPDRIGCRHYWMPDYKALNDAPGRMLSPDEPPSRIGAPVICKHCGAKDRH